MDEPTLTFGDLLESLPPELREGQASQLISGAYAVADEAHAGQMRKGGDKEYIQHPLEVAILLADMGMDADTIAASLLHDVIEDSTEYDVERLTREFGAGVATLVDGVTKLEMIDQFSQTAEERRGQQEAESLRKMFIAMAEDVRVVLIKLADRLHNMRTLDGLPPERQVEFARETMDIFAAPPRNRPKSDVARSVKKSPPPRAKRTCPKRMKATTIVETMARGIPRRELGSM